MPQRDTFVIMGLRRKRARVAGEVEAIERQLATRRETLSQLDAVLRVFEPKGNPELIAAIRPCSRRCLFFRHGELTRVCLDAFREAARPQTARQIGEYALLAKGLPSEEGAIRTIVIGHIRTTLYRLAKAGKVRKVVEWPDVWWEMTIES
jgi:hypothetical protein